MTDTSAPRSFRVNSDWHGATIGDVIHAEDWVEDLFRWFRTQLRTLDEQMPVGTVKNMASHLDTLSDMEADLRGDLMKAEDQF